MAFRSPGGDAAAMSRILAALLAVTALATVEPTMPDARPYALSQATTGLLLEDVWPPLPVGAAQVAELARKERSCPWAADLLARMRAEARTLVSTPAAFPVERIGWRHDFFSRATGEHLVFDPADGASFRDPLGGGRESLPEQRRAWVLLAHERQYRLIRGVALLARLDGDAAFARWSIAGLVEAAAFFARTDLRKDDDGCAAQYHQMLYDAAVVSLIADAWSCVRGQATASERTAIEAMLAERVPVLTAFMAKRGTHNMSAFVAMALAQAAAACARPDWSGGDPQVLVRRLVDSGLPRAADGGRDGFWCEGTTFYHFYTACALIGAVEGARAGGAPADPQAMAALAAMLRAPLALADGACRVPLFGDLGSPRHMDLRAWRHLYEWGAGRADPAAFGPALAALYADGTPRRDLAALAYGPDALPAPGGLPGGDSSLPAAGVGVLRGGGESAIRAVLRCGRYVGGHDHPDRLGLLLDACGVLISPDLGEPGYALREGHLSYHRTTMAHNTLFADEAEQTGAAELTTRPGAIRGTLGLAGVDYVRTVWLDGGMVVVLDSYAAATTHRFGWIHHAYGPVAARVSGDGAAAQRLPAWPARIGWRDLAGRSTACGSAWAAGWRVDAMTRLELLGASDGAVEVTTADAPGNPLPDRQGALVLRAPGQARRIATVFMPCRGSAAAPATEVGLDGGAVLVRMADGTRRRFAW